MEITCGSCSTRLTVPEENLPKNVSVLKAQCPKCKAPLDINIPPESCKVPAPAAPAEAPPPAEPAPQPEPLASLPPAPEAPAVDEDEGFVEGRKLAMACFDSPQSQGEVKAALEALGYTVHAPAKPEEAVARLHRNKYELLILQEEFGGSAQNNPVLKAVQPMAMSQRRHMCVGLVGQKFRSLDNMAAFARSVNFVVAERELGKIQAITRHAVAENDVFYRLFREAIHEAGRV